MRQILLLSFALLPVAAHAQMKPVSSVAPAPTLTASVSSPRAAVPAHAPAATATKPVVTPVAMRQTIHMIVSPDFVNPDDASLTVTFGAPNSFEEPKLAKFGSVSIAPADLAKQAAETTVAVRVTIDPQGMPLYAQIERSAGDAIDADALAAVRQFRFKPATVDHAPVYSNATVDITIDKR